MWYLWLGDSPCCSRSIRHVSRRHTAPRPAWPVGGAVTVPHIYRTIITDTPVQVSHLVASIEARAYLGSARQEVEKGRNRAPSSRFRTRYSHLRRGNVERRTECHANCMSVPRDIYASGSSFVVFTCAISSTRERDLNEARCRFSLRGLALEVAMFFVWTKHK